MCLTLKSPNNMEISNSITFQIISIAFTESTICGINSNNTPSVTYPCQSYYNQNEKKYFSNCNNPNYMQDFIICCYNINININKIPFPTINLNYNLDNSIKNYDKYSWSSNARVVPITGSEMETGFSNGVDLLAATQTGNKINSIQYEIGGQTNAFGKANILLTIAREIPRGSIVVINGDLSKLLKK